MYLDLSRYCTERQVVVGMTRLHYLDWGTAGQPVVVFLHGGGLNAHTWDLVCGDLRHDYHCIALDLRGHGDSEWSPALDYTLDAHCRDLDGFLRQVGADRPVLVGQSLGGQVAIRYATRKSTWLEGLVVVDTSPFARNSPTLQRVRDLVLGASAFDSMADAIAYVLEHNPNRDPRKLRHTLVHSLRRLPDGRWTWKRDQRYFGDEYIADLIEQVRSLAHAVPDIQCPTLVVRGTDGALTARDAERFCALLQDGQVATVDAGHNVQSDNPAGLVEALRAFLPSTPAS